jgi:F0F1-type ATP synthase assembly protein I
MPDQSDQVENARASLQLAFSVLGQIGALTLGALILALVAGLLLDKIFSTRPLFTVLFLVGSFPVTYYLIYRIALNAVGKIQPAAGKPAPVKEEKE